MSQLDNIQFVDQAQLKQVMLANADKADKRYVKKSDMNAYTKTEDLGALAFLDEITVDQLGETLTARIEDTYTKSETYTQAEVDQAIDTAIDNLGDLASLDKVSESDLTDGLKNKINDVYTKAEVYTKEETYSSEEIDSKIANSITNVYKPAGSATLATLPELGEDVLGNVYNMTEEFTIDERFVENEEHTFPSGTNVVVVEASEGVYKFDVLAGFIDLQDYVKFEDINVASSAQIQSIIDSIYAGMDLDDDESTVETVLSSTTGLAEISNFFAANENVTTVKAKLNNDITVPDRTDGKISTTFINSGQTLELDLNGHDLDCVAYALYINGGNVTIKDTSGNGVIKSRIKENTYPVIQVDSGSLTMEGGIIDTRVELEGDEYNWTYGVVCAKDGVFVMNGGEIHTDAASCISITNGTAASEGARFIIGGDAKLITDNCAAVYLADNKDVIIKDNAIVDGGIVARMGNIVVKDNAQVINDHADAPGFGELLATSGVDITPAGIMGLAGCYNSKTDTNDMTITVSDNAIVSSSLGEAIGIAKLDTLYEQNVSVVVDAEENLSPAIGSDRVKIYSHDDCAALATEAGKTIPAKAVDTAVTVTINGVVTYNDTI